MSRSGEPSTSAAANVLRVDVGDAIMWHERHETEDGEFEFDFKWGAVMAPCNMQTEDNLSVHQLVPTQGKLWSFSNAFWLDVPIELVQQVQGIDGEDGNAPRAWDALGFRMVDGATLVRHSDEVGTDLFPVGDGAFDVVSSSDGSMGSLKDFVVPDGKCEAFTFAKGEFAEETHRAVREFDKWAPKDDHEAQVKAFIVSQEKRAMQLDDNIRASQGMRALEYNKPHD